MRALQGKKARLREIRETGPRTA
ncbi:hypothetical protein L6R46_11720 [Myxococcota bacterium]|nr:hypothetical protein [Myxococcota bacterium]